jgi:predicted Zn-dependent protease
MTEAIEARFRSVAPAVDFCSMRLVTCRSEQLWVRQGVLQPLRSIRDRGAMITVIDGGGYGYGATSDLSESGLRAATERARSWAEASQGRSVVDFTKVAMPRPVEDYSSPVKQPWNSTSLAEKIELLQRSCASLKTDDRIVDWEASLWFTEEETVYLCADGSRATQTMSLLVPDLGVVANDGSETLQRTLGGRGYCRQGGLEVLDDVGFAHRGSTLAEEALELLAAPNCPEGTMDLLLAPDQMMLQIHESIGHPLELDRILGDERNYAGTSFVTLDMFGSYQYGSDLLNITFDPERTEQFASYCFDDDGQKAERQYIIRNGILERPLGGITSQARAAMAGVSNSRADGWNRPPIDRMANLNLEPGTSSFDEMVSSVQKGVYMRSNCSWSIDDSRNKFQFGCEWGRLIEDGELTTVVKKPNYRGVSATFWRNLKGVGALDCFEVLGTPYCGKGEPNQVIRVGHASPTCLFGDVDVFGGA